MNKDSNAVFTSAVVLLLERNGYHVRSLRDALSCLQGILITAQEEELKETELIMEAIECKKLIHSSGTKNTVHLN